MNRPIRRTRLCASVRVCWSLRRSSWRDNAPDQRSTRHQRSHLSEPSRCWYVARTAPPHLRDVVALFTGTTCCGATPLWQPARAQCASHQQCAARPQWGMETITSPESIPFSLMSLAHQARGCAPPLGPYPVCSRRPLERGVVSIPERRAHGYLLSVPCVARSLRACVRVPVAKYTRDLAPPPPVCPVVGSAWRTHYRG